MILEIDESTDLSDVEAICVYYCNTVVTQEEIDTDPHALDGWKFEGDDEANDWICPACQLLLAKKNLEGGYEPSEE